MSTQLECPGCGWRIDKEQMLQSSFDPLCGRCRAYRWGAFDVVAEDPLRHAVDSLVKMAAEAIATEGAKCVKALYWERLAGQLRIEAQAHACKARTANATLHEIYQICSGATGEPGTWNGAEPVRQLRARLDRLEAAAQYALNEWNCSGDVFGAMQHLRVTVTPKQADANVTKGPRVCVCGHATSWATVPGSVAIYCRNCGRSPQ